jgi:hypothetical protein
VSDGVEAEGGRPNGLNRRFNRPRGQVKPLTFAVKEAGKADPMQNGSFVAVEIEHDRGRCPVEEEEPAASSLPLNREAANSMTGQASQGSLAVRERKNDQVKQALTHSGQVATESEQPLTVLAKRGQTDGNRPAIGPEDAVTFVVNIVFDPVAGRITTTEHSQCAGHPGLSLQGWYISRLPGRA